jgi:chorismate mutase
MKRQQKYMSELSKLGELRLKTDRELVQLIRNRLEVALGLVRKALHSVGNPASEQYHLSAEREHTKAAYLLHLVYNMAEGERRILEAKLAHLRKMLDKPPGCTPFPSQSEIVELARTFWRARGCPDGSPEEDWYRAEQQLTAQSESLLVRA